MSFGLVLLVIDLTVIALDEERESVALAERGADHDGDVLRRTLLGVRDLGACDLENDRAGLAGLGGAQDGARGVVGHRPHVDRRHGKPADIAAPARQVQPVDRSGTRASHLAELPEQPASGFPLVAASEHGLPDQPVGGRGPELGGVAYGHTARHQTHRPTVEIDRSLGHIRHSLFALVEAARKGRSRRGERQTR
jgi:hypothetical protein